MIHPALCYLHIIFVHYTVCMYNPKLFQYYVSLFTRVYVLRILSVYSTLFQASLSLKLCCRASWTCLLNQCKMFVDKSIKFCCDLSEDSIIGLLAEACTRSAFVLDVLYQSDYNKVNKLFNYCLEIWAAAENLFDRLASPTALLKQWVKVAFKIFFLSVFIIIYFFCLIFPNLQTQCKIFKVADVENNAKTLYSVLSCSVKMSKRALGILIEQV